MVDYDTSSGKWSDGFGGYHKDEASANEAETNKRMELDEQLRDMKNWGVLLRLPHAVATIFAFIYGALFKIGFIGKVIQTIVVSSICMLLIGIAFPSLSATLSGAGEFAPYLLAMLFNTGIAIFTALWYWLWHYDTLKIMNDDRYRPYFLTVFSNSFAICFAGYTISVILGIFISETIGRILPLPVSAIAVIYYLKNGKSFALEAARTRKPFPRKFVMFIGAIATIVISVFVTIFNAADKAEYLSEYNEKYSDVIESAKNATNKNVTAIVAKEQSSFNGGTALHSRPEYRDERKYVIGWIEVGNTVVITGNVVKYSKSGDLLVPVEYDGHKGYIPVDYLKIPKEEE
jgi:cation transport ATPase